MQSSAGDVRLVRVEKQLAASILMLRRATLEAESWSDQSFADSLREQLVELERLHGQLMRGKRPRQPLAPRVRN